MTPQDYIQMLRYLWKLKDLGILSWDEYVTIHDKAEMMMIEQDPIGLLNQETL